ncbi:MAG: hypothetical protein ACJ790_11660 [Myxococcaceae bacterium]
MNFRFVLALCSAMLLVHCSGGSQSGSGCTGNCDGGGGSSDSGTPPEIHDGGHDAGLSSQEAYSYAGCEDAGSYTCANLLVFSCALHAIQGKYNACNSPSDCVAVVIPNCVGVLTDCAPAAISDAGLAAYRSEATTEINRYCATATCFSAPSCAYSFTQRLADCVNGRCVPVPDDGGF